MHDLNPVFIPGPTNMPDRLRHAMDLQTRDHRAPDFVDLIKPVLADTRKVFKSATASIFLFPASGTGGWEAAIVNTLSPGDTVLVGRYGMFSHKWIDLCQRLGLEVEVIENSWGLGAPSEAFANRLAADNKHRIKAVLATHNETATGVVSDIAAVRQAIDTSSHPALLFVDCVSSLASMDFRMDEWGVDIAVSGSQKGFMLATGMAILAVSEKAMSATKNAQLPRCYFDFAQMSVAADTGSYPYTPPLQLIHGLRESLTMLQEEGLENVFKRHRHIAEGVRRAIAAWGLKLCAQHEALYSDTVSAIYVPGGFVSDELVKHAFDRYGVSYGIGLGEMAGKAFRIGHLGMMTETMALSGIATIEMAMKDLNYPIELGSGVIAAQQFYQAQA